MSKNSILALTVIVIISVVISSIFSNLVFNPSKKRSVKIPVVQSISSSFPDVKTDPNYNTIFNSQALDPTQLIQIGPNQNPTPFSSSGH